MEYVHFWVSICYDLIASCHCCRFAFLPLVALSWLEVASDCPRASRALSDQSDDCVDTISGLPRP